MTVSSAMGDVPELTQEKTVASNTTTKVTTAANLIFTL
jgi:hypothetical protein